MSRSFKTSCRCATTESITLNGLQTIDTIQLEAGDLVLVKDQSIKSQNGIYVASEGQWVRSSQFSDNDDVKYGCFVMVLSPQVATYIMTTNPPISLETTEIEFSLNGGISGGGGSGELDPSDIPRMNRTRYVGTFLNPPIDSIDETGAPVAPFSDIQSALDSFDGYTQGTVTVLVDDAPYPENLSFRCEDKSIVIRSLSGRRMQLEGSHAVRVSNSNYGLYVDGVGGPDHANTFTVFDAGTVATDAFLVFRDCDNFTVAQNPGDSSVYNLVLAASTPPVSSAPALRRACNAARATGSLFAQGVVLGNGSSGTLRGDQGFYADGVRIRPGATIQSGATSISIVGPSTFEGNATLQWLNSAGTLDLGRDALASFTNASGARTLTNASGNGFPSMDLTLARNASSSFRLRQAGTLSNFGEAVMEMRTASSASLTAGLATKITGQFLTGNASSVAGPGETSGGDNQGSAVGETFKAGTGVVRGGDATGADGTQVGGDVWVKPGTGATRHGNTMISATSPDSFVWQGMERGLCLEQARAVPTAAPPSQRIWMFVDPLDLNLRTVDAGNRYRMLVDLGGPLTDADATLVITDGAQRFMPAGLMSADRTKILDDADALDGEIWEIYRFDTTAGHDLIIQNHDAAPLATIAPGRWKYVFQFDGTDWSLIQFMRLP